VHIRQQTRSFYIGLRPSSDRPQAQLITSGLLPLLARRLRGVYDDAALLAQLDEGVQQDNDDADHKEEDVQDLFLFFFLFLRSSLAFCLASSSRGSSRRE